MSISKKLVLYLSLIATLKKTGDERLYDDGGHACDVRPEAYRIRRMFFHRCERDRYSDSFVKYGVTPWKRRK